MRANCQRTIGFARGNSVACQFGRAALLRVLGRPAGRPYQSERGCVADQPQRLEDEKVVEKSRVLRLALPRTAALRHFRDSSGTISSDNFSVLRITVSEERTPTCAPVRCLCRSSM